MEPLDCGDHSCDFANDKSGMRTNGGCRCLKPMADTQRHKVKAYIRSMELQVGAITEKYHQSTANVADLIGKLEQSNRLVGRLQNALEKMLKQYPASTFCEIGCENATCEYCALEKEVRATIERPKDAPAHFDWGKLIGAFPDLPDPGVLRRHPYTCGECRAEIRTDICPKCTEKRYCVCPGTAKGAISVNGCCPGCRLPYKKCGFPKHMTGEPCEMLRPCPSHPENAVQS